MHNSNLRVALTLAAAALIAAYYWRFTSIGLSTGFSHDDLMNLFFAWRVPFSDVLQANLFIPTGVLRPFGALFYASFFYLFGLDPVPYRVFGYAVLWLTLPVTYLFVRYATGSRDIGALTVLLHCCHGNFFPLYYGSGCIYDVFAFLFYYSALALTAFARRTTRFPGPWESVAVGVLFALAINSKESAASLPLLLLLFELLRGKPRSISWMWREGRSALVTGSIGLLYFFTRFLGPNNLLDHSAYTPAFTIGRYLESTATYLNDLSAQPGLWNQFGAAALLLVMGAIAAWIRNRHLAFSWLLIVLGSAPIAFVEPRGLHAYFIPLVGYAMYGALVLVALWRPVSEELDVPPLVSRIALFLTVLVAMWTWQQRNERDIDIYWRELSDIEFAIGEFRNHPEWFQPGAKILIRNDSFPEQQWASSFIALLTGKDRSIQVQTLVKLDPKPSREQIQTYTRVLGFEDGRMVEVDRETMD